jgi:hypothetical protein
MKPEAGSGMPLVGNDSSHGSYDATAGRGAQRPAGGGVVELGQGTQLSITVPSKYIEEKEKPCLVLRTAIDSLYLSYPGELSEEIFARLDELKEAAQSGEEEEQAKAQITIGNHLFAVASHGAGRFRFVLFDDRFRLNISRGTHLPLVYAQISSEYLTAVGVETAERELRFVVGYLGRVDELAQVSRADLCLDFIPIVPMDQWAVQQWMTRARKKAAYWAAGDRFTGWMIGQGGDIQSRTYDKVLEVIDQSHKTYLFDLWQARGWKPGDPVWRQEFQANRNALKELQVRNVPDLLANLDGLWRYFTENWLRLTHLGSDSNKSRWPTHPLWEILSNTSWNDVAQPTLKRIRASNLPTDDRLFTAGLGYVASFMGREGITSMSQGVRSFLHQAETYHRQQGGSTARYLERKARIKGRLFSTINNRKEQDHVESLRRAEAHRKARDGEE